MKLSTLLTFSVLLFFLSLIVVQEALKSPHYTLNKVVVDSEGPIDPWGKSVGDVDGDGLVDLVVAGHAPQRPSLYRRLLNHFHIWNYDWPKYGELVWYQNGSWEKHLISNHYNFRTDAEVADIDRDGNADVVAVADQGLFWFQGPRWHAVQISSLRLHDLEIADLDNDGDLDVIARNQSEFGANDGNLIHIFRQEAPDNWTHMTMSCPHGEGLFVDDINQDGLDDIAVNQFWYENPGVIIDGLQWTAHPYCSSWLWADAFLDRGDINQDGVLDIVMSPAELAGDRYRISWCDLSVQNTSGGVEHIIDDSVESVIHSVRTGDFNGDKRLDIVAAHMYQGNDPDEVVVYWNVGSGLNWRKDPVGVRGSHSMRVLDYNQDGVDDFFGANWEGPYQKIELWEGKKKERQP